METVKLSVEGMHCGSCVNHVSAALNTVDGVDSARVSVGSAEVSFDAGKTSRKALIGALAGAGYAAQASPPNSVDSCTPSNASSGKGCGCRG